MNKRPGADSVDAYYMGDGPADIAGALWCDVYQFTSREQFRTMLQDGTVPPIDDPEEAARISELVRIAREYLTEEYRQAWGRAPYRDEIQAAADFTSAVNPDEY